MSYLDGPSGLLLSLFINCSASLLGMSLSSAVEISLHKNIWPSSCPWMKRRLGHKSAQTLISSVRAMKVK